MSDYVCERCLYKTPRRSCMIGHINKTTVCEVIGTNISIEDLREKYGEPRIRLMHACVHCKKEFCNKGNLTQHLKHCKVQPKQQGIQEEKQEDSESDNYNEEDDELESASRSELLSMIRQMKKNERKMKKQLEKQTQSISTNIITNNITNNIINDNSIKVVINNFGKENLDYLTTDFAVKCFEQGAYGILAMLNEIYFNDNHAENNNVRLQSMNNKLVKVMTDKEWVPRALGKTISKMIDRSRNKIIHDASPIIKEKLDDNNVFVKLTDMHKEPKSLHDNTVAKLFERREKLRIQRKLIRKQKEKRKLEKLKLKLQQHNTSNNIDNVSDSESDTDSDSSLDSDTDIYVHTEKYIDTDTHTQIDD